MKSHEEKIQTVWPEWELIRTIGHGSFGAVYEIQRIQFGKTEKAAVKVLTIPYDRSVIDELYSEGYDDASISKRMHGELQNIVNEYYLMAELKGHTNIVNCDDMQYTEHKEGIGWDVFIKMELLTPLSKVFGKGNRENVSDESVIKLGKDICQALTLCEKKNIVHRDIKPQNIFRSEFGEYKLGDFGIAKTMEHTTSGTKTGTYKYMAPEVYSNKPYGHSADIYSLGLVLYWLLNENRMPFLPLPPTVPTSKMEDEARSKRFRGDKLPEPKNGSPELKKIVLKACAFKPKDRFASAQEMLNALKKLSGEKEDIHNMAYEEESEYDHTAGGTAGSSFSGTRTERDADYSFSSENESTMGNSWEDTQGTMGDPRGRTKKESAEDDKTVGKQTKGYGTKTSQQKEKEIEPEVTAESQKKEKKENFFGAIVFWGIILVVIYASFHENIEFAIKSVMNPENEYYANGNIKTEEMHDSNGNRIKVTNYDEDGNRQEEKEYNSQGKIIKQSVYNSNGSIDYMDEYDSEGNNVKSTRYNSDGSVKYVDENEYDSEGNEVKSTWYNSDGSVDHVYENEYDSEGNEVKSTRYNSDGSVDDIQVNEYDSDGNRVKSTSYNSDGSVDRVDEY